MCSTHSYARILLFALSLTVIELRWLKEEPEEKNTPLYNYYIESLNGSAKEKALTKKWLSKYEQHAKIENAFERTKRSKGY